jgi:hypothetical protein
MTVRQNTPNLILIAFIFVASVAMIALGGFFIHLRVEKFMKSQIDEHTAFQATSSRGEAPSMADETDYHSSQEETYGENPSRSFGVSGAHLILKLLFRIVLWHAIVIIVAIMSAILPTSAGALKTRGHLFALALGFLGVITITWWALGAAQSLFGSGKEMPALFHWLSLSIAALTVVVSFRRLQKYGYDMNAARRFKVAHLAKMFALKPAPNTDEESKCAPQSEESKKMHDKATRLASEIKARATRISPRQRLKRPLRMPIRRWIQPFFRNLESFRR